ncbi:MAG: glycosyltransferase [Pseudomonadota bacterium]
MERAVVDIAHALQGKAVRSIVASGGGPWVERLSAPGIRHITVPLNQRRHFQRSFRAIVQLIRNERPLLVHARSQSAVACAATAVEAFAPAERPRLIVTSHSYGDAEIPDEQWQAADRVIAVSRSLSDHLLQYRPGLGSKIRIVPRGVDLAHYSRGYGAPEDWLRGVERRHPELANKQWITLVGRYSRWKGQRRFLSIVDELGRENSSLHGVCVGAAPYRRHRRYLRRLRWRARLTGVRNFSCLEAEDDLSNVYGRSCCVVSLSDDPPESYGRALMEALACGVPVIGYDHGGATESAFSVFPQGAVRPRDDAAVAQRIRSFLHSPPTVPAIPRSFDSDNMLRSVMDVYRELGVDV